MKTENLNYKDVLQNKNYYFVFDKYRRLNIMFWMLLSIGIIYNGVMLGLCIWSYYKHGTSLLYGLLVALLPPYPLSWFAFAFRIKANNVKDDIIMRFSSQKHLVRTFKKVKRDNAFLAIFFLVPPLTYLVYLILKLVLWLFIWPFKLMRNHKDKQLQKQDQELLTDSNIAHVDTLKWKAAVSHSHSFNEVSLFIPRYSEWKSRRVVRHPDLALNY